MQPVVFLRVLLSLALVSTVLLLGACGGGGGGGGRMTDPTPRPDPKPPPLTSSDPAYHLSTARFTTHQPNVLEQIGAHHAYAKGLTGRGVRIGIDDSIVDYTQNTEFGSRVKLTEAEGASLAYDRPDGDLLFSDVSTCRLFDPTCNIWSGNSAGDLEAVNDWVRQIVDTDGWPTGDDSVFVVDEYYSEFDPIQRLLRWKEVPTPYGEGTHGTTVASVASGKTLGVAAEATIIPVARNLTDDQEGYTQAVNTLLTAIADLPSPLRMQADAVIASSIREESAKFDIINRSYGLRSSPLAVINEFAEAQWLSRYLPKTLDAIWQVDTPSFEKTIVVYAAGNDSDRVPGLGAALPYFLPVLRDHTISVVATDPATGLIAGYSNRCGPLPSDWDSARHGPHYCLAAPGAVRGTRGNTAVVKRMLDTANRSGHYAELETYGAGFLDIEAALSPVGTLNAGQSARPLSRTMFHTPAAFGAAALRASNIELAVFDRQDFPFWIPLSSRITVQDIGRSPIPVFTEHIGTAAGLDALGQHWTALGNAERSWSQSGRWVAGFGPTSASVAREPYGRGWGYGLSFNDDGYLGSRTSGAFGSDLRSGMSWISRTVQQELSAGWSVEATGTLAFGAPRYEKNAIFEASPSMLSALSVRIGTESTGLTLEQPLRAETGTGKFRIENGQIENGRRLYGEHRIRLRPDSREVRMTLRHEHDAYGGRIAFEAGATMNAGHAAGEHESHIGLAFRRAW